MSGGKKTYYLVTRANGSGSSSGSNGNRRPCYWMVDNGEKWINVARYGNWEEKSAKDVVHEVFETDDITRLDWAKTPLHDHESNSGWLSRDGRFYGCPAVNHDAFAHCVLGAKVSDLENTGWVRVYDSSRYTCETRLSAEQKNWLAGNGHKIYE